MQHHLCPSRFPPIHKGAAGDFDGEVLVIGAGVAGLFAALSLRTMGVENFTVLEASQHVGGRLRAAPKAFAGGRGEAFDVGAEWIHSTDGARVLKSMMQDLEADDEGLVGGDGGTTDNVHVKLMPYQPTWYFRSRKSRLMTALYRETKFKSSTWHGWLRDNVYSKVKDKVEMEMPVEQIIYGRDSQKVEVVLANGQTRKVDRVICTASLGVLKESIDGKVMRFDPPLSEEKQKAIRTLDMPPGFRILFHMKEKFYPDLTSANSMCSLLADLDDLCFVYDAALGKDGVDNNNILAFVAVGNKNAGELSELNSSELGAAALRKIDELFDGKGSANIIGDPIVQNWAKDPYVRGAYTFSGPKKHRYALAQAEGNGRLIFAGEHTSKKHHSLVPGAAYEGRRAALEAVLPL